MTMDSSNFSGFKWDSLTSLEEGNEWEQYAAEFCRKISWDAVCHAASQLRDERPCNMDPSIAVGGRHMVRIVRFDDNITWIARLRRHSESLSKQQEKMQREIDCIRFIQQNSNVPVPVIFGHNLQDLSRIGAATMFMECLQGNVAMDLNFDTIPSEYKESFLTEMGQIQIANLQLPQIGTIIQHDDGSFAAGPIEGLGGPFATATEFFEAWAAYHSQFRFSADHLRKWCGPLGDDVVACTDAFPPKLRRFAQRISRRDSGPFPLCHGDFGHNNIIVDDHYRILGVIDWEDALVTPWETIGYPRILEVVPRSMQPPELWDADGNPTDEKTRERLTDQKTYLSVIKSTETQMGLSGMLSATLGNENIRDLGHSLQLFVHGKMGFYSRALDYLEDESNETRTAEAAKSDISTAEAPMGMNASRAIS